MSRRKNIIGDRYGRLTVTEFFGVAKDRHSLWKCQCDCGAEIVAAGQNLKSGATQSCGCLRKEITKTQFSKHGMSHSSIEYIRSGMVSRCSNPKHRAYHNYGGRGISVCTDWKENPQSFYEWAEKNGYEKGLTLERIDNDGNYEPSNCKWATRKEQSRNKRTNHKIEFNGETLLMTEWDDKLGLRKGTISDRVTKLKWSETKALSTPKGTRWSHRQEV